MSGVAHDDDGDGCEHGRAVSSVASGGAAQDKPCPTTDTTVGDGTTPSTIADDSGDDVGDDPGEHGGTTDTTTVDDSGSDHGGNSGDHGGGTSGGSN